jgi:hypothetical protein
VVLYETYVVIVYTMGYIVFKTLGNAKFNVISVPIDVIVLVYWIELFSESVIVVT